MKLPTAVELQTSAPCLYVARGWDLPCHTEFMGMVSDRLPEHAREKLRRGRYNRMAGFNFEGTYYDRHSSCLFWVRPPGSFMQDHAVMWVIAGLSEHEATDIVDWHNSNVPSRSIYGVDNFVAAVDELFDKQLTIARVDL